MSDEQQRTDLVKVLCGEGLVAQRLEVFGLQQVVRFSSGCLLL
jgi:hypothetical protein